MSVYYEESAPFTQTQQDWLADKYGSRVSSYATEPRDLTSGLLGMPDYIGPNAYNMSPRELYEAMRNACPQPSEASLERARAFDEREARKRADDRLETAITLAVLVLCAAGLATRVFA